MTATAEQLQPEVVLKGARLRQVTRGPTIHHHPFFFVPAYDARMKWLYCVEHDAENRPQLCAERRSTREFVTLTDLADLNAWAVHPGRRSSHVYFTTSDAGWRLDPETGRAGRVVDFRHAQLRGVGVGSAMGTTAICPNERYWAIALVVDPGFELIVVDLETGGSRTILRGPSIGHMQFCPDDPELLFYAGPLTDRAWVVRVDGTGNRRVFERDAAARQWITHETWLPGRRELFMIDWPAGALAVHLDSGRVRRVAGFNAWHASVRADGALMVADTNHPDVGLQLFDPRIDSAVPVTLCLSRASSAGEHWRGPFPYDRGPVRVNAPQHTHAHPSFSPDGRSIVFTSDCSGHPQVYEIELPNELPNELATPGPSEAFPC